MSETKRPGGKPKSDKTGQSSDRAEVPILAEQPAHYGAAAKVEATPIMHRIVALESQHKHLATKADIAETNGRIDTLAGNMSKLERSQEKMAQEQKETNRQLTVVSEQLSGLKDQFDEFKQITNDRFEKQEQTMSDRFDKQEQTMSDRFDKQEQTMSEFKKGMNDRFKQHEQATRQQFAEMRTLLFYLVGGLAAFMSIGFGAMLTLMVRLLP